AAMEGGLGAVAAGAAGTGTVIAAVGGHAAAAGGSAQFMTQKPRALADESSSGRWRQFDGTLVGIIGDFGSAIPGLNAASASTPALAYTVLQARQAAADAKEMAEEFAFGGEGARSSPP